MPAKKKKGKSPKDVFRKTASNLIRTDLMMRNRRSDSSSVNEIFDNAFTRKDTVRGGPGTGLKVRDASRINQFWRDTKKSLTSEVNAITGKKNKKKKMASEAKRKSRGGKKPGARMTR
jgi:hypothetical protein